MSSVRNFRISVNLCMWFHDHRQKAKIFINDDIQTIGDLENRIEQIFKIKNVYLTNRDEYLPPTEDVRILQKDDTIWVMKKTFEEDTTAKIVPVRINNTEDLIKSKKRSNSITEEIDADQPLRKKKKHSNEKKYEGVKYLDPSKEQPKEKKKLKECDTINNELEMSMEAEIKSKDENVNKELSSKSTMEMSKDKKEQKEYDTLKSELGISVEVETIKSKDGNVSKASSSKSTKKMSKEKKKQKDCEIINNKLAKYVKAETVKSKNGSVIKSLSSNSSDTDTFKDDTSIQNASSRPYINTILPVLQSHINSYNSKMNNKMETSSTTSLDSVLSPMSVQNDLQSKINKEYTISYKSKGPLASYKKCVSVPTVTDKYLENKKVNIVKIEYLSGGPLQKGIESSKTEGHENYNSSLCDEIPKNINNGAMDQNIDKGVNSIDQTPTIDKNTIEKEKEIVTSNSALGMLNSCFRKTIDSVRDSAEEATKMYNPKSCSMSCLNENITNTKTSCLQINEKVINIENLQDNLPEKKSVKDANKDVTRNSSIPFHGTDLSSKEQIKICESTSETLMQCETISPSADHDTKKMEDAVPEKYVDRILIDDGYEGTFRNKMDDMSISEILIGGDISSISEDLAEQNLRNEKNSESIKQVVTSFDRLSNASNSDNGSNSIFSRRKYLSGIGQLLEDIRSNDSVVTGESMDTDISEFITKRQRKRVRRRKKKNVNVDMSSSHNDSSVIVSNYIPKPVKTRARPTIHLKFEEEGGESLKVVDLTKENGDEKENVSHIDTSCLENITLESELEETKLGSFNIEEKHILKSPSIGNLLPRIGDIIAFKILRITENYTPEVSSYITGKVIEFNYDTKTVLYDIINGLQQCKEPEGKLSLKSNDKRINSKREFIWSEIIDPRLLFP